MTSLAVFLDLLEDVAGKPREALRDVSRVTVTGQSRRPALEVILAVESAVSSARGGEVRRSAS